MTFLVSTFVAMVTIVAALVPPIHLPGVADKDRPVPYPAPPGYLLPWPGGEIHAVTQGEDTVFTHNGLAAYAYDFDLNYDTVVAARAGKVMMIKQDSNAGGCDSGFAGESNYIVIDHGDGTSSLYMHLAYNSVLAQVGQIVDQGQPVAISGETGVTCSANHTGPGLHLHFQVERMEPGRYFTQSLPIAFDDITTEDGVPHEGHAYVSGNYGPGASQKIKLTPHHVPRPFHPTARPIDPTLFEAPPPPAVSPTPTPDAVTPTPVPSRPLTAEPSSTPTPTRTPTDTPVPAPTTTPVPTNTPSPTATPVPLPTPTNVPASPTPQAQATAQAVPSAALPTLTPASTPTPTPTPTAATSSVR